MAESDIRKSWARILAKAWDDPDFKARLLADCEAVCAAEGLQTPGCERLRIVEDAPGELTLVMPPRPSAELSEQTLEAVSGGATVAFTTWGLEKR